MLQEINNIVLYMQTDIDALEDISNDVDKIKEEYKNRLENITQGIRKGESDKFILNDMAMNVELITRRVNGIMSRLAASKQTILEQLEKINNNWIAVKL